MQVGSDELGRHAIPRAQDILADRAFERELLAPLLALDEKAQLLGQRAQRLNDISRRIAARTARTTRHALAAEPDRVALQQTLDLLLVARLDDRHDLARIVVVELGRRADSRTDPAVHARLQPLAEANVLHQHFEITTHNLQLCIRQSYR